MFEENLKLAINTHTPPQADLPAQTGLPLRVAVAVALLDSDGRVLVQRRPEGKFMAGFWEFPGGKPQQDESPEQALIREVHEELGLKLEQACLAPFTFASHTYEEFHLLLALYVCRNWQGEITAKEKQELRWIFPNRLNEVELLPADIPLVAALRSFL